jgi:APA family basic amino acid/polyamine antiporter
MDSRPPVPPRLGLWDTVSVIAGIMIGVGIYEAPARVFANTPGPAAAAGVWLAGGFLALVGALCFAELAAAYPQAGGEYLYLSRAYGRRVGFLFGWTQFVVIRAVASIAAPAFALAEWTGRAVGLDATGKVLIAVGAVAGLTLLHLRGTEPGKWALNALTLAKALGLASLVAAGLLFARPTADPTPDAATGSKMSLALALLLVMYAYDGWNEAAYVAAEVRDARRNVPRALVLGTVTVTALYLLVILAYLAGLGPDAARASADPTVALLERAFGEPAARVVAVLGAVAILGSLHGTLMTGSRLFAAVGAEHRAFSLLGRWDGERGVPSVALAVQAAISVGVVLAAAALGQVTTGFERLVSATSPVFWFFMLLTVGSLFVLRWRDPVTPRPFRVPLGPVLPLAFAGSCLFMLVMTGRYAFETCPAELAVVGGLVLAGAPVYALAGGTPGAGDRSSLPA